MIQEFHELTNFPNICGSIDATHILSTNLPSKKVTLAQSDFFNIKQIP